nr:MAG TPA: homing endonuclease [Caudoviricetes sp.]
MEIWKDIENYEGYYQISSYGRVKNIKTGNILIGDKNNIGYKRVTLYSPIKKRFFIHRLVAYHFCDGYNEGLVVNHKDGNKQNNNADNLEWITHPENDLHAFKLKLRQPYPCTFKHRIIAYDLITNEIIKIYNNTQECCDDLKVARTNIYNCCNGKQKSCKGYGLKYEE